MNHKLSYACDPLIMRQLRERRGWTQATLAEKSGYSLRLISKMESGEPASRQALEDIAEALSLPEESITYEDLISSPIGLARQYIAALHQHQLQMVDVIEHFLDENIVFIMAGDPAVIPFAGTYHGIEGVRELTRRFFGALQVPDGYDHLPHYSYTANGTDVLVWGKSWLHPIGQPMPEPMPVSHLLRFRNGKMILFDDHFDTHRAAILFAGREFESSPPA
ncbi:MAG: helix-turn-helix domain-containing protein [Planctomyces sp.]|jgi:transcriptional regulator with XRE-family HTH domain